MNTNPYDDLKQDLLDGMGFNIETNEFDLPDDRTPIHRLIFMSATFVLGAYMMGCGSGAHFDSSVPCSSNGFLNKTNGTATDAQLMNLWSGAQQQIATQPIPMDPVTNPHNTRYDPPDPRALNVAPSCKVEVVAMPNVLPPPDPAGFACSQSPTGFCGGRTLGSDPWTVEVVEPDLLQSDATGWEFQNVILEKLGYDVKGR